MDKNWEILVNKAKDFNVCLTDKQLEQFKEYWRFLYDYNSHTNLVSSAEPEIVVLKHFADSLSIGLLDKHININSEKSVLDVGIGGGFPGVPIIIAYPKLKLYALDSVGKKTEFISQLSSKLEINDRVEVINSRAEDFALKEGRKESFDIGVSRAVSRLNVLLEYILPFIKVGGYFVAYKAKTFQEEIDEAAEALSILGGKVLDVASYTLSDETRNLILIKKIKKTPEKYPRKTGLPLKNPL